MTLMIVSIVCARYVYGSDSGHDEQALGRRADLLRPERVGNVERDTGPSTSGCSRCWPGCRDLVADRDIQLVGDVVGIVRHQSRSATLMFDCASSCAMSRTGPSVRCTERVLARLCDDVSGSPSRMGCGASVARAPGSRSELERDEEPGLSACGGSGPVVPGRESSRRAAAAASRRRAPARSA